MIKLIEEHLDNYRSILGNAGCNDYVIKIDEDNIKFIQDYYNWCRDNEGEEDFHLWNCKINIGKTITTYDFIFVRYMMEYIKELYITVNKL